MKEIPSQSHHSRALGMASGSAGRREDRLAGRAVLDDLEQLGERHQPRPVQLLGGEAVEVVAALVPARDNVDPGTPPRGERFEDGAVGDAVELPAEGGGHAYGPVARGHRGMVRNRRATPDERPSGARRGSRHADAIVDRADAPMLRRQDRCGIMRGRAAAQEAA